MSANPYFLLQTEKDGALEFFTRDKRVRVGRVGGHSMPICAGGSWHGVPISALNCADLEREARRWYQDYLSSENNTETSPRNIVGYIGPEPPR